MNYIYLSNDKAFATEADARAYSPNVKEIAIVPHTYYTAELFYEEHDYPENYPYEFSEIIGKYENREDAVKAIHEYNVWDIGHGIAEIVSDESEDDDDREVFIKREHYPKTATIYFQVNECQIITTER